LRVLVAIPEGKRALGRPRLGWKDEIKMYLLELGWEAWTSLIWLRIGEVGGHL
jgi:hypothetical protein